ncbi:Protein DOG1-like 4 [Linum perenne]
MPMTTVGERFTDFVETWTSQLEDYLQQLLAAAAAVNHVAVESLVSKLTQHHKGYYSVKWALVHEDVLPFFSLPWASPLEKAYSWFTGWKPSTMFKLVLRGDLDENQRVTIEELRVKVKLEEDKVERDMERQHVALAERKMVELSRLSSCRDDDDDDVVLASRVEGLVVVALKGMADGLEKVVRAADCVRLRTLKGILEILTPLQCVAFFAKSSALFIRLRKFGLVMDRMVISKTQ